jgi:uncharacterized membrane protein
MSPAFVLVAVFTASAVEMVEALTIVLATGVTRGWRSTLQGVAVALLVLGVLIATLGPALVHLIPLDALRVVVGALLLVLGLQWLRKAVLRASGHIPMHDEDIIYRHQVEELSELPSARGRDATAFTVAFKGVFLEGIEVVMIVLTVGSTSRHLGLAAAAGLAAVVIVAGVGALVARRLTEVPENSMKMVVGIMLTSFGTFWTAEGLGVPWPGADLSILGLIGAYVATTAALVAWLSRVRARAELPATEA